jgi:hypothetical protein
MSRTPRGDIVGDKSVIYEIGPGVETFRRISTADTNAAVVKTSPGVVYGIVVNNINAAARYLKLYNIDEAPTVGTTVPLVVIPLAATSAVHLSIPSGIYFDEGIGIGMVTGIADNSTAAVAANEHIVTLLYV